MTNPTIDPIIDTASALQALIEAVQPVGDLLPAHERSAFEQALVRARRARVGLMQWVDEQRS